MSYFFILKIKSTYIDDHTIIRNMKHFKTQCFLTSKPGRFNAVLMPIDRSGLEVRQPNYEL